MARNKVPPETQAQRQHVWQHATQTRDREQRALVEADFAAYLAERQQGIPSAARRRRLAWAITALDTPLVDCAALGRRATTTTDGDDLVLGWIPGFLKPLRRIHGGHRRKHDTPHQENQS